MEKEKRFAFAKKVKSSKVYCSVSKQKPCDAPNDNNCQASRYESIIENYFLFLEQNICYGCSKD